MIKAAGKTSLGLPLLLLGLTGENVTRLAAAHGHIKAADLAALGLPAMDVAITYGRTEQDILKEIKAHGLKLHGATEG